MDVRIYIYIYTSTAVETAIAQCTSRWAMARGHRLNTFIVLAAVHDLSGLFRAVSAVEPSLFRPPPPSLISLLASVDVQQYGQASQARWEDWNSACSQVSTIQACVACGTMASTWIPRLILKRPLSSSSTIRQCIVKVVATSVHVLLSGRPCVQCPCCHPFLSS